MNYYDELGVRYNATAEEIRLAYRGLVKLMHPDLQRDERVKILAETQMRRLSSILATLTDIEKRQDYDEQLRGGYSLRRAVRYVKRTVLPWFDRARYRIKEYVAGAVVVILGTVLFVAFTREDAPFTPRANRASLPGDRRRGPSSAAWVPPTETRLPEPVPAPAEIAAYSDRPNPGSANPLAPSSTLVVPLRQQPAVKKPLPPEPVHEFDPARILARANVPRPVRPHAVDPPHSANNENVMPAAPDINETASTEHLTGVVSTFLSGLPSTLASGSAARNNQSPGGFPSRSFVEPKLIHQVQPTFPTLAKSTRVSGVVEFDALISNTGNVEKLQIVRGPLVLVNAAEQAILQWKYKPALLDGKPVGVHTQIRVAFSFAK